MSWEPRSGRRTAGRVQSLLPAICCVSLFAVAPQARAAFSSDSVGTAGASFLSLSPDARASGMGNAYTAVSDDASAIQYNPAGLAAVSGIDLSLSQTFFLDQIDYEFAGFAEPLGQLFHEVQPGPGPASYEQAPDWGVIGLGILYLDAGSIPSLDNLGNPTGSFTPTDMAVSMSYAKTLDAWDLGATVKFIQSYIAATAQTGALDLGARYHTEWNDHPIVLAAAVLDIGGGLKFINQSDPLPTTINFGADFLATRDILLAADLDFPEDDSPYVDLGAEFSHDVGAGMRAAARLGYSSLDSGSGLGGLSGLSAGAGVTFKFLRADYAWVPFGLLGNTNRISLSLKF